MRDAEVLARLRALNIVQGRVIADSVAEMINRSILETAPTHYAHQSKDGIAIRASSAKNLKLFFGNQIPASLTTQRKDHELVSFCVNTKWASLYDVGLNRVMAQSDGRVLGHAP
ncbi:MAG: hypothetical protein ABI155_14280 [Paralcaligenes sp.]